VIAQIAMLRIWSCRDWSWTGATVRRTVVSICSQEKIRRRTHNGDKDIIGAVRYQYPVFSFQRQP
jgi:hypothetical protein